MSFAEALLFKEDNVVGFPKLIGKLPTSSATNVGDWYFRSPEYSTPYHGRCLRGDDGLPPNCGLLGFSCGVRPCFLI